MAYSETEIEFAWESWEYLLKEDLASKNKRRFEDRLHMASADIGKLGMNSYEARKMILHRLGVAG